MNVSVGEQCGFIFQKPREFLVSMREVLHLSDLIMCYCTLKILFDENLYSYLQSAISKFNIYTRDCYGAIDKQGWT